MPFLFSWMSCSNSKPLLTDQIILPNSLPWAKFPSQTITLLLHDFVLNVFLWYNALLRVWFLITTRSRVIITESHVTSRRPSFLERADFWVLSHFNPLFCLFRQTVFWLIYPFCDSVDITGNVFLFLDCNSKILSWESCISSVEF